MFEPNLPAQIKPVMRGPSDLTTACETSEGSHDSAPNDDNEGWDCLVNTTPANKEVKLMSRKDLLPIEKHCFIISFPSNGGVKAFIKNSLQKSYTSAVVINISLAVPIFAMHRWSYINYARKTY
jgi:hypothetical protein